MTTHARPARRTTAHAPTAEGRSARTAAPGAAVGAQAVLCGLGALVTALPYGSFFAGGGYLPRLAVMAAAGTAAATATCLRPARRLVTVLVAAAVFALSASYAVLGDTLHGGLPGWSTLRTGARGLVGGWAAMLTIGTPAPASGRLLMTPAALTFAAAFAATAPALRTRAVPAPAAALLTAEIAGLLFTANDQGRHLAQSALLLTVLLLTALLRATPAAMAGYRGASAGEPAGSPSATTPAGAVARPVGPLQVVASLLAAALVVGVAAAVTVPPLARGHDRFDPRGLMPRHLRLAPAPDPLSEVRAQLRRRPATTQFTVRGRGAGGTDRVRTVVVDTFDGARWTSSGRYPVSGPRLPGARQPGDGPPATEHVVLEGLAGPFLPVTDHPATVRGHFGPGARLGYDARSGTLVTDAARLTGASYALTGASRPRPSAAALRRAAVGSGPAYAAYTALPSPPPVLVALAGRLTAGARGPYAELVAIDTYLRRQPYSLKSPPGQSYGTLTAMLAPTGTGATTGAGATADGGRAAAGGSEQHAAAFAVLARSLGIPTRIAVGYLLPGARHGTATVTTADAWAWPQVYFEQYGWIDFDPTDPSRIVTVPPGAPAAAPPPGSVRPRPTAAPAVHPRPTRLTAAHPVGADGVPPAWAAAVLTALLTAAAGANVTAKQLRRRRRRLHGSTSQRVAGAWHEVTDRLAEAGLRLDPSLTVEEIAEAAAGADPATRDGRVLRRAARTLSELAPLVCHALYAADPSGPSDVARAWRLEHRLRRELYPPRRTPQRALHRLKPTRTHHPRRSTPPPGAPA